jgi:hypothetical protein
VYVFLILSILIFPTILHRNFSSTPCHLLSLDTCPCLCSICIVTYSGSSIHDGTLLHSKSQYTTVKHSQKLLEHMYASDPHGLGTLTPIEFFQQDLLWQSSNTHSNSCSQKASKHTSGYWSTCTPQRHLGVYIINPPFTSTDDRMSSPSTVALRITSNLYSFSDPTRLNQ